MPYKFFQLKQATFFLLLLAFPVFLRAGLQQQNQLTIKKDSAVATQDSLLYKADSTLVKQDSPLTGTIHSYSTVLQSALQESRFLNITGAPAAIITKEMAVPVNTFLFYVLLAVVVLLASLRFFYNRYFNNLFKVFFNTSLRQSQLTDQLLQAKQASLFFNILFVITGGLYLYLLLLHFNWMVPAKPLLVMGTCILGMAAVYFLKYIVLKFTGWVTGYKDAANTYLFIIFLINKILGTLLVPFVIVIAFAAPFLRYPAVLVSLLLVGLMFFLRFLRSYGLLQNQVRVSRVHFFMYIIGIELLPLLLIYKALMVLLNKKL